MTAMHRTLRRFAILFFPLWLLVLSGCATDSPSPVHPSLRSETVPWRNRSLHIWRGGTAGATPLVFIHGSPGDALSWDQFLADAELQKHFEMAAIDRLGFAQTGRPGSDLAGNTAAIDALLQRFDRPAVLIGHSYGGPLALSLAAFAPERVQACVLLAAPGAPHLGKTHTLNAVLEYSQLKWLLPSSLRSSNSEMLALRGDLRQLQTQLSNVRSEVILIHGKKDRLVDPRNLTFLHANLTAAKVQRIEIPNQGHFLPWEQFELIKKQLLQLAGPRTGPGTETKTATHP